MKKIEVTGGQSMDIQLIRNATLWIEYKGVKILVDPLFGDKEAYPPIQGSENDRRNPLVPLPVSIKEISNPDLVLVSHVHNDHWDPAAIEALPKETMIICQPENAELIKSQGFKNVVGLESPLSFSKIEFNRTDGEHGTGEIGVKMGKVSGFVLKAEGEPTLYIAGDTIYCSKVEAALKEYQPDVTVVNAGGARFVEGDPITMTPEDVCKVARFSDNKIVAVHMDAINHCLDTREKLRKRVEKEGLLERVSIPDDGEILHFIL
jgi:L-ascorbate metabolism protein UlaG (beta-lactamase superfamily)